MTEKDAKINAIIGKEEEALKAAVLNALKAMNKSATHANIKSYQAAKKALEDYQAKQATEATGERFRNIEQASAWIIGQGFLVSPRTVRNHAEKMQGFPRKQKDGSYLKSEIEAYAIATWENPSQPTTEATPASNVDHGLRLKKALADERELKVAQLKGSVLDAEEEEERDAAVLLGVRRHLENNAPDRAKAIVSEISSILSDEQRGQLSMLLPEIVQNDLEFIAEIFDRLAQAGGIEVVN